MFKILSTIHFMMLVIMLEFECSSVKLLVVYSF